MVLSGWLNVNKPSDFNKLHDHGSVPFAAVYYVQGGACAGDMALPEGWREFMDDAHRSYYHDAANCASTWERPTACAGELLLKTQLKAWTDDYAFLRVKPVAGTLWLFPGYMPHAVLPRGGCDDADGAPSLRVSVACNIATHEGQSTEPLPVVWSASRMA